MTALLDQSLILVALLSSVAYALLALGPRTWRRALAQWLLKRLERAPTIFRRPAFVARLERAGAASACGGCDSCGDTKTPAPDAREVKVPISAIGRRR